MRDFAAQYHLGPPAFEDALAIPIDELQKRKAAAAAAIKELPDILLSDSQRTDLSGRRCAEIGEISHLVARGLDKHPEIVEATGVAPDLLRRTAEKDAGATVLFDGATRLCGGGDDGAILTAALLEDLSGQVLSQVRDLGADPHTPAEWKSDLEDAFAEPFLMQAEHRQAPQKTKAENQAILHPPDPQRERAGPAADPSSVNAVASPGMIR
jgi:hypothetical protein